MTSSPVVVTPILPDERDNAEVSASLPAAKDPERFHPD
jgi:hypothetical protein